MTEAENPRSPLHSHFEWDDGKAAHNYRIWQARVLIADIEIVGDDDRDRPAFVSLANDRIDGGYRSLPDVLSSAALRKELLQTALNELTAFQQRYDRLKELASVWQAVEKVKRRKAMTPILWLRDRRHCFCSSQD